MSYKKAMKQSGAKHHKKRGRMYMGFSQIGDNERRKFPALGSAYYDISLGFYETEEQMIEARNAYVKKWEEETKRLMKENPNLKLI